MDPSHEVEPTAVQRSDPRASVAPYLPEAAPPRAVLDPRRPYREAGRSHRAAADRLRRETRRVDGPLRGMRTPREVADLRRRADAATATARMLEPLSATGWVVLHDRTVLGTSATVDHVLVGPPGVVVVQDRPATAATVDPQGRPWADGVPLDAEREQVRWVMSEVLRRTVEPLSGDWFVRAYPVLVLHLPDGAAWQPDLREPACVLVPGQLRWALGTYAPGLSSMHVADMTMVVEEVCPPAPLA